MITLRYTLLIFCFFLSACQTPKKQFSLPQQIDFKGESYIPASKSQINEMQHWLYLPQNSAQTPQNWQKGFLIFADENNQKRSLKERLTLRQQAFDRQPDTKAALNIVNNELRSEVIYPPTERYPDVQLEVTRGRDLACGYGQIQYASKRSKTGNVLQTQDDIELVKLAQEISKMPWLIDCKSL